MGRPGNCHSSSVDDIPQEFQAVTDVTHKFYWINRVGSMGVFVGEAEGDVCGENTAID